MERLEAYRSTTSAGLTTSSDTGTTLGTAVVGHDTAGFLVRRTSKKGGRRQRRCFSAEMLSSAMGMEVI